MHGTYVRKIEFNSTCFKVLDKSFDLINYPSVF